MCRGRPFLLLHIALLAAIYSGASIGFVYPAHGQILQTGEVEGVLMAGPGLQVAGGQNRARYLALRTIGYSITDRSQVGLAFGLDGDFAAAPSSILLAEARYYVPTGIDVRPYAGVHAGLVADVFTDEPRVRETGGPQIGIKWGVASRLTLSVELRYALQVADPARGVLFALFAIGIIDRASDESEGHAQPGE